MQIILQGQKDIKKIKGQFLVQIDKETPHADIKTQFYLEKRIRHISEHGGGFYTNGMFYSERWDKWEDLERHINSHEDRFYRFITKEELAWLVEEMYKLREI